jgi:membrane-bound lytic murein transglycosylase B
VRLGFDPGTPDGVVGSKTRAALRAFQRDNRLTPDGYPTPDVLQALREVAQRNDAAG